MTKLVIASLCAAAAIAATTGRAAAVPTQVSFAGRLADADGPLDRAVDLDFKLYDGVTLVWQESHTGVEAVDGLAFVALGSESALDDGVFTGAALELEVTVDGATMSPRLPIAVIPYATRAGRADRAERADVADLADRAAVADRADDADLLGGQPPAAFAAAAHDHDGAYLPAGANLSCPPGAVVTALSAAGDVVCAADEDTQYTAAAGGGLTEVSHEFGIAGGGVTSAHIADGAVGSVDIANNAIGSSHIAAGAVGTAEIANSSVGWEDLQYGAVDQDKILGTEVRLYMLPAGCSGGNANTVTLNGSSCLTDACGPLLYRACGGSCGPSSAQSCQPTLLGFLLATNS